MNLFPSANHWLPDVKERVLKILSAMSGVQATGNNILNIKIHQEPEYTNDEYGKNGTNGPCHGFRRHLDE